jgi:hypothetical protein
LSCRLLDAPELGELGLDTIAEFRMRGERPIDEGGVDAVDGAGNRARVTFVLLCAALFL